MIGHMVKLTDVVEHRAAGGDGVGHPGDSVRGDVLEGRCSSGHSNTRLLFTQRQILGVTILYDK